MFALTIGSDLCQAFSGWPTSAGWTGVGLAATVLGFLFGAGSLILTWLIYRWTNISDAERHAELKDALRETGGLLRDALARIPAPEADLKALSPGEEAQLRTMLGQGERIVRLARSGSGKGNHPWQAITTAGRVLQVYTGGRAGGVHAKVLE